MDRYWSQSYPKGVPRAIHPEQFRLAEKIVFYPGDKWPE